MIIIIYTRKFLDMLSRLGFELQEDAKKKIELLKDRKSHKALRVHKLHGKFSIYYAFSINYKYRIIFKWVSPKSVALMAIGGHEIYQ